MYHDISWILCSFREYRLEIEKSAKKGRGGGRTGSKKFPDDFSENTWLDCMGRDRDVSRIARGLANPSRAVRHCSIVDRTGIRTER